jgi:hypothetical protein
MAIGDLAAAGHTRKPLLAVIRQNCIECCVGAVAEVRRCPNATCAFWPFRMGSDPFTTRGKNLTDERRAELADRMRALRPKGQSE